VKATALTLRGTNRVAELAGRESTLVFAMGFWLALIQVSIAASQIVLAFVLVLWLYQLATGRAEVARLPLDWPIGFFALFSIASAAFSFDPTESFGAVRKLFLLTVPYLLVSGIHRKPTLTLERFVLVLIVVADVCALLALWQYFVGDLGDINHRIRGFMSHYMTFSGLLMGVSVLALAQLLFARQRRIFLVASLTVILTALTLSLTRSAWIGMLVSASLVCFLRDRRLLVAVPILLIGTFALVPDSVRTRARTLIEPDRSGRDRVYMMRSGFDIAATHPWLGVGPNMVPFVYPIYRLEGAPELQNIHLHNNVVQIAAERGLPCLAAWIWLIALGIAGTSQSFRGSPPGTRERALAAGSLALLVAGMTAGLFEYNFGDSEFLMLFLFAIAIPIVLHRNAQGGHRGGTVS
jgi:O-antigen ligase